ncbi:MAG: type IX secretion system membrane protein PorP/SprF [Prevotellaceae bacterium]|jgi:type IX secretion system PorP/SprF family membrane protein|nr:type IX secretion system membrane protein PorP/SprF [Prevotellaceae bacterium]
MRLHIKKILVYFAEHFPSECSGLSACFCKFFLTASLIVSLSSLKAQQDVMFVQTFFNQAFVNPGAAGHDTAGYFNVIALNRTQIAGFDGAPVTTMVNVNGSLKIGNAPSGVSLTLYNDKGGFLTSPSFNLGYAYQLKVGKGSLGIGLSAGMFFSILEPAGWLPPDGGNDPAIPTSKGTKQSFDAGVGLFYSYRRFYAGLSCMHLTCPAFMLGDAASKLKRTFYVNAGHSFTMPNPDIELRPTATVLTDLATANYDVSATVFFKNKYWVGADCRFGSSFGFLAGMNLLPNMRIGYSYGYNISELSKFAGGNHEVMLTYRFSVQIERGKQKYKSIRYL